MRRSLFLALLALVALAGCRSEPTVTAPSDPAPVAASASQALAAGARRLEFVRAGAGDVGSVVRAEIAKAGPARIVVYVGAPWCEPCRRFHDAAIEGTLDDKLPPIRFVEFDLDVDEARLKEAGYTSQYIPLFAVPAPDGRATGKQIAGSVKGPGAPGEITPRLVALLK